MIGTADEQETCDSAECTGKNHRSDNNLFNVDSDVFGGVFALADNGNFIAVLAVSEINIHKHGDGHNNQDVAKVSLAADCRKPAGLGRVVDNADVTGSLGNRPFI